MAADGNRSYHIEHHYLDVYYDDLYLIGCTATHAYVVTRVGAEDFFAHRVSLRQVLEVEELNDGKFESSWYHYDFVIKDYLHACACATSLCVITRESIVLFDADGSHTIRKMVFEVVDACTMNEENLIVVYNHRYIFVYNYYINHVVCNRIFDHSVEMSVVAVNFFFDSRQMFIVNTSNNYTHFYRITDNSVLLHKQVCLLDTEMNIDFTREIRPQVLVTSAGFEMSVAWPNAAGSILRKRSNLTACIVDVEIIPHSRNLLVMHDVENDVQLLNADLATVSLVQMRQLMKPHMDCGMPVHRIQRAYKSMTMCPDSVNVLAVLLPSADLCTIKFF